VTEFLNVIFRPSKCRPCTVPPGAHAPLRPLPAATAHLSVALPTCVTIVTSVGSFMPNGSFFQLKVGDYVGHFSELVDRCEISVISMYRACVGAAESWFLSQSTDGATTLSTRPANGFINIVRCAVFIFDIIPIFAIFLSSCLTLSSCLPKKLPPTLRVPYQSMVHHHHPALPRRHTLILDRLLTFLVAFSTLVLKLHFPQSLFFRSHLSFPRVDLEL